jgi:hypothetical protein
MPRGPYTYPAGHSRRLHPNRNALRTAMFAAVVTVSLLLPAAWVLQAIGAL